MFVGQHGAWNRAPRSGYQLIAVPFTDTRADGPAQFTGAGLRCVKPLASALAPRAVDWDDNTATAARLRPAERAVPLPSIPGDMNMLLKNLCAATVLALASAPVLAAECSVDIAGNDQMQFDKKEITVSKSCKQFTVNLKHPGKLAKNVMGHNWVLTKQADMQGAVNDGMAAGLDNNYVKKDDARVIAHTKVIGGGESDSVTFDVSKLAAGQDYAYFCSFPGHFALMKGVLKLVD